MGLHLATARTGLSCLGSIPWCGCFLKCKACKWPTCKACQCAVCKGCQWAECKCGSPYLLSDSKRQGLLRDAALWQQ